MIQIGENRAKTILAIGLLFTLQPFTNDPFLPSGLQISKDLAVSSSMIQLSLSALSLGFALGTVFAGPLSDSIGRRRPLIMGLGLYIIGAMLCAFAPSYPIFVMARILQGTAGSALAVVGIAILRDLYSGMAQIKASSRAMLVGSLSWFIAPTAGSLLLNLTNWRGVALIVGGLGAVIGLLAIQVLPETKLKDDRAEHVFTGMGHRFLNVLRDRPFRGLVLTNMFISMGLMGYLGFLPLLFARLFGVQSNQVGLFFAINSFAAYVGVQSVSKLAQRYQAKWLLMAFVILAITVSLLLVLVSPLHPSLWLYEGLLMVWIFVYGTSVTPIQALALQAHGEESGTAMAVMATAGSLGPVLAGPVYTMIDRSSGVGLGALLLVFSVLALASLIFVVRPWRLAKLN